VSDTSQGDLKALASALDAVEAAMMRLDAGTYGQCEGCGEVIDPELLERDVTAAHCAACAQTRHDG
jgi:DnaK suppressor protein